MRVLVTGAAGFIGSSVTQALLKRGDQVIGVDNFDSFYQRRIKLDNLQEIANERFSFHEGDLLDVSLMSSLCSQVDRVVHLAALAGVRPSLRTPARYMRVNVEGTTVLLEAARKASIDRLIVASSSSVYGSRSVTPFREDDPCDRPASPYAASKRATEAVCATYHSLYELGISCLRYFTVFGPRQRPEMAIHYFVHLSHQKLPIPQFGDGSSGRDYTYIDDIVQGTLAALDRQDGAYHVYNLGGTNPVQLHELITAIGDVMGHPVDVEQRPWQPGDVPITCADITKAQADLGYRPTTDLRQGLEKFVAWYRLRHT